MTRTLCSFLALVGVVACGSSQSRNEDTTAKQANVVRSDSTTPGAVQSTEQSAQQAQSTSLGDDGAAAADVVQRYYQAIAAHDYARAYKLWEGSGRASGKTFADFAAGFGQTAEVHVTIHGTPRVEGAAGSQYVTVPVVVTAVQRDGQTQHFTGTYTLRRAVADGATPEQRAWHIYAADLAR